MRIIGINKKGLEGGNPGMCKDNPLPWLQDTAEEDVWGLWEANRWDVIILDNENNFVRVYNVGRSRHDLAVLSNYDELKSLLLRLAAK